MSRVQLALNVDDLDEAITFYSKLFNTAPAKVKEDYANFAVAEPPLKLVLIKNPGTGGTINHLGVEVESSDTVHAEIARLSGEGLFTDEEIAMPGPPNKPKSKIVVVGAGLGGCVCAFDLGRNHDVTVIELGKSTSDIENRVVDLARPAAGSPHVGSGPGGGTILWHNGMVEIDEEIFQKSW